MEDQAQTTGWEIGPRADPSVPVIDWRRHVLGLIVALAIGLALRLWWLSAVDTQPVTDFDWYFERAKGICGGLGYSVDGDPTAYWPVGYPGVLAVAFRLFGATVWVGKALNTLLTLTSIVLCWRLAFRLFRDPRVANGSAFLLAVHPAFVAYSGILASEPLYTCLILAGTLCCLSEPKLNLKSLAVAGALFGLAVLVRPQAALIPFIVLVCAVIWDSRDLFRGQFLKSLAVVYVVVAIVLTPWTVRNFSVFNQFVFVSTNGGDNLLIGNSPRATGRYLNPNELGYDLTAFGEVDRDHAASRFAKEYVKSHFRKTVSLWPAKLAGTFLSGTDAPYWAFQKTKARMVSPGLGSDKAQFKGFRTYSEAFTLWLLTLAGLGALLNLIWCRRIALPVTGLALIAYAAVLSLAFFGNPRFAFPIVPFLAMYATQSFALPLRALQRFRTKKDGQTLKASDRPTSPHQALTLGSRNS